MNKREVIIIVIAIVVIVIAVIATGAGIYYWSNGHGTGGVPSGTAGSAGALGTGAGASTTAQSLPSNIVVPAQNATSVPAGVAAPTIVTPGSPSGSTNFRSFTIKIFGGVYAPNTVIVNQGDTVHINLTAVDGNYDFTQPDYGMSLAVAKGQSKVVQFDANSAGKFTFYCASCGGPTKGPTGYVEVVAK